MKKVLRKALIIVVAVVCACSVHISVSAQSSMFPTDWESISKWIENMLTSTTQESTTTPAETTTNVPDTTTAVPDTQTTETTTNLINNSGTGVVPSTQETTTVPTTVPTTLQQQLTTIPVIPTDITTETVPAEPEPSSFTYEGSLSDLLEEDSAALIVQTPTENFTLNAGLVVNNGERGNDFEWQQVALIAAAVLFVVLTALIVALLIQKSKKVAEEKKANTTIGDPTSGDSGPVPVEVMSAERIAELLGTSPAAKRNAAAQQQYNPLDMTSEDSAAAIKIAALMGQLTHSYSDPLIRKYTEEPVRISPIDSVGLSGDITAAQILEATDSMLDDITGNEKYAADISGLDDVLAGDIDAILNDTKTKICPECNAPVQSGDVFCHACGAYVG